MWQCLGRVSGCRDDAANEEGYPALRINYEVIQLWHRAAVFSSPKLQVYLRLIVSLISTFRDQYNEILMTEYCAQFERDLQNDNYTPITVNTQEEFMSVVKQFNFYKKSMEQQPFPRRFPFSRFVISVFTQAKNYLVGCKKFMEDLQLTQSEVDDTVRRYANVLLSRWSGSLRAFVSKRLSLVQVGQSFFHYCYLLLQLVQITVNIAYLEKSCDSLGHYITKLTSGVDGIAATSSHQLALSQQVFQDARSEVEQQIDAFMRDKIDEMLDLMSYDWEIPIPTGKASDQISDVIKFLETTFISFTNLPSGLAKHVCMQVSITHILLNTVPFQSCKHLAQRLTEGLLTQDFRIISTGALEQFNLDVLQCEVFTSRCPVPGFDQHTLPMTFSTLRWALILFCFVIKLFRQLLDLTMLPDWTTYFAEYGQESARYNRVQPQAAMLLLDKWVAPTPSFEFLLDGLNSRREAPDSLGSRAAIVRSCWTRSWNNSANCLLSKVHVSLHGTVLYRSLYL